MLDLKNATPIDEDTEPIEQRLEAFVDEEDSYISNFRQVSKNVYKMFVPPHTVRVNVNTQKLYLPCNNKPVRFETFAELKSYITIVQPERAEKAERMLKNAGVKIVVPTNGSVVHYKDPFGEEVMWLPWNQRYYPITGDLKTQGIYALHDTGFYLPVDKIEDKYTTTTTYSEVVKELKEVIEELGKEGWEVTFDGGDWVEVSYETSAKTYYYHPMNRWRTKPLEEDPTVYSSRSPRHFLTQYVFS